MSLHDQVGWQGHCCPRFYDFSGGAASFMSHGTALNCSALATGSASGGALAGAFPTLNQPVIMDLVVTSIQVAQ